ncbi:oligosaccharide flippase family protein [Tautonia plasticadhaerens]|uniref:Polysaccharide biosynthesis protein n=1 Tax=Tautonia plasticadhaerens TaxID=2527974 RepID=A0A518H2F5_9BACT|nr:oligosaccharide flippase family protein [Tautonia plasticadhaerens]QDV35029.1 Polysaccharide biosynthesis protein [Tautonia plasticadhaerens]
MPSTSSSPRTARPPRSAPRPPAPDPGPGPGPGPIPAPGASPAEGPGGSGSSRRIAWNFAALSAAEVACRALSVVVTLALAQRLGRAGYGRVEFAFNVVFWLVLLVREGLDVIATREIARHPRLIRPLVNHILAIRGCLAAALLTGLVVVGSVCFSEPTERRILVLYGLLLLTTAIGLDFVYRGLERMGLVAVSLLIRTAIYAVGVGLWVIDPSRIVWVPICLVGGELVGIALVWACYVRSYGLPRPTLRATRALRTIIRKGRPVYLIQISQAVIGSADLLVVGVLSQWADVGLYGAPHRIVTAALTFGIIFRQVVFPMLARTWRGAAAEGREALDGMVRVLMLVLLPMAVGATVLAEPLIALLLGPDYRGAGVLLAVGAWRIPLLTLAFLYQTALIALNREAAGVRMLLGAAVVIGPLTAALRLQFDLVGASASVVVVGLLLTACGYRRLWVEGRAPAWHHHLGAPLLASAAMVPACLLLARWHVLAAVLGGASAYLLVLGLLRALPVSEFRTLLRPE